MVAATPQADIGVEWASSSAGWLADTIVAAMPTFVNWLLRLIPTNPIAMRLVQGGSKRLRHLYIRAGYLAIMIVVLLFALLNGVGGAASVRSLATAGANMFEVVSYVQVALICLLTPVFMAGAIAQEANPRTWDILLTTPLNNLQIVLGNLFGRLFFVLALLFSTLPLFLTVQYFGGVPGRSIFASYAIAGTSSLLVAAIAVTLSVTRTAGRRAVFIFYIAVVIYLFATYALDYYLRLGNPVGTVANAYYTTVMTPLNPFTALEVLLRSNTYVPHDLTGTGAGWLTSLWLSNPIAAFNWLCVGISAVLIIFCTIRMRVIGARVGTVPWYRRMFGLAAKNATVREPRRVGKNPIAWREAIARGRTLGAMLGRWGFVAAGVAVAVALITMFHTGSMNAADLRLACVTILSAEVLIITLVALNTSATAVSREREDGTLDIILTTPIQPGPYLAGKLRGLIQFLVPMMLVPVITMVLLALYMMTDGLGKGGVMVSDPNPNTAGTFPAMPIVLPEGAIAMPLVLVPFVAFCVMVGLHWSIKSKGTISSVLGAVGVVIALGTVFGACAIPMGRHFPLIGGAVSAINPINLIFSQVYPAETIPESLASSRGGTTTAGRTSVIVGALIAGGAYTALVYGMHSNMKRTFMMTVRKLAGTR